MTHRLADAIFLFGVVMLIVGVLLLTACTESRLATGPSGVIGGSTFSIVDVPPITVNDCPSDAPTQFVVTVDAPSNGLYKFSFDWRRTGPTNSYVLETRRRERNHGPLGPALFSLVEAREHGSTLVRYFGAGIYHFRLRGNCGVASLWSLEVVKNAGEGNGADHINSDPLPSPPIPTVPPIPPVPTVPPTCIEECAASVSRDVPRETHLAH